MCDLEIIKHHVCLVKRKNTKKLPKLEYNKVPNTWDRANIVKIILTQPRVCLPRFHLKALQDHTGKVV